MKKCLKRHFFKFKLNISLIEKKGVIWYNMDKQGMVIKDGKLWNKF